MKNPGLCAAIMRAVAGSVRCPVTVKIRKGWDETSVTAPALAVLAEEAGLQAVTVHGRTVEQGFSGQADWEIIKAVKQAVGLPVIGNGDLRGARDAAEKLNRCVCDGVMIGRAALGNPWIFQQVRAWLERGEEIGPPGLEQIKAMAIRHLQMLCNFKGEKVGVREMRRHACWYISGVTGSAALRTRLVRAGSATEMTDLLLNFQPAAPARFT